jgi:hypothetical protein
VDLDEALEEVLNAASQSKQYPPGVTATDSSNEPIVKSIDVRDLKRRA